MKKAILFILTIFIFTVPAVMPAKADPFGLFVITVKLVGVPAYLITECTNDTGMSEKECAKKLWDERSTDHGQEWYTSNTNG